MDGATDRLAIEDYALIGDQRTAALVNRDGSIDWMCLGRFDGPAVFCRLLDKRRGGFFRIAPVCPFAVRRRYLDETNVLVSDFQTRDGALRLTDFFSLGTDGSSAAGLYRKLECIAGAVDVDVEFRPTFDLARSTTTLAPVPGGCIAQGGAGKLRLRCCPIELRIRGEREAFGTARLRAGEAIWFHLDDPSEPASHEEWDHAERELQRTARRWREWISRGRFPGYRLELVQRSALLLKLLTYAPTGAVVAAPTTSLPESAGGVRNWDYRFTWPRDAAWIVSAFMGLGYHDESMSFIGWLDSLDFSERGAAPVYSVDGRVPSEEELLDHLDGFGGARPVRIGNDATRQDQHDVFGDLVAAIHLCADGMPEMYPFRPRLWAKVRELANLATEHWSHPDHGIWEHRMQPRDHVTSKLMCWVAVDRALKIAERHGRRDAAVSRWYRVRTEIRSELESAGFEPRRGAFTAAYGEPALDAGALLIPLVGFLPPSDPRVRGTVQRIREELEVDGLLKRYQGDDGLPGQEGYFVACSFWLAEALALDRRLDEAHEVFSQVTRHANDVGLLSEEIEAGTGRLMGNFPQGLSHLALVRAALTLDLVERGEARGRALW